MSLNSEHSDVVNITLRNKPALITRLKAYQDAHVFSVPFCLKIASPIF